MIQASRLNICVSVCLASVALGAASCSRSQPGSEIAKAAAAPEAEASQEAGAGESPTPEQVVQQMVDFYKKQSGFSFELHQTVRIEAQGRKQEVDSEASVTIQRPNRIAIRPKDGAMGVELVSDGQTLWVSPSMLKKYAQEDAPASLSALVENPMIAGFAGGGSPPMYLFLLTDDPYKSILEGVTASEYAGQEQVDGKPAHHLKFQQEQFDWDLWIAEGAQPVILQAKVDMAKAMAGSGFGDKMKMTSLQKYQEWLFDIQPAADAFAFTPPAGAEKVDSFFGSPAREEVSPLVGQEAPGFELDLLDGGKVRLEDHRGRGIVMLDFWATWCGPCVRAMPIVAELAGEYRDKGVVSYAVNQGENAETIRSFLDQKKLKITAALDPEEAVGNAYGIEGIPMLVLIDKKGIVQSVHVGYSPAMKQTLQKQLGALLEGKDLAAEALAASQADAPKPEGLEEAWSHGGAYGSVAVSADGAAVYAAKRGTCDVFDPTGKEQRSFPLPPTVQLIRAAALTADGTGELVGFGPWGRAVVALQNDGTTLWEETGGMGIDDVWPADLDGDGRDEIIVGYNGATGLHVFGPDGQRRWEYTGIGNVWHVAAGDVNADKKVEVVSTSAAGQVHLFDSEGKKLDDLQPDFYANMVRTARTQQDGQGDMILAAGTSQGGIAVAAVSGGGATLWSLDLPAGYDHVDSMAVSPDGTLAAIGLRGGLVAVVDLKDGRRIGQAVDQGQTPQVAWTGSSAAQSPLLLVATGRKILAFRLARIP